MISAMKLTASVAFIALLLASTSVAVPLFDSEPSQVFEAAVADLYGDASDDSNEDLDSEDSWQSNSFTFSPPSTSPPPCDATKVCCDAAAAATAQAQATEKRLQALATAREKAQQTFDAQRAKDHARDDVTKEGARKAMEETKKKLEEAKKKSDEIVGEVSKAADEAASAAHEAEHTMGECADKHLEMRRTWYEVNDIMGKIHETVSAGTSLMSILSDAATRAARLGLNLAKAGDVCKDSLDKSNEVKKKNQEARAESSQFFSSSVMGRYPAIDRANTAASISQIQFSPFANNLVLEAKEALGTAQKSAANAANSIAAALQAQANGEIFYGAAYDALQAQVDAVIAHLDAKLEVKRLQHDVDLLTNEAGSAKAANDACQASVDPCKDCSAVKADADSTQNAVNDAKKLLETGEEAVSEAAKLVQTEAGRAKAAMESAKAASKNCDETKKKADEAKEAAKTAKESVEAKKKLIENAKTKQEDEKKKVEDVEKDADAAKDKVSCARCG